MLAGHGKSSIRPGHAPLRGGGNSGDILEKSPPQGVARVLSHQQGYDIRDFYKACGGNMESPFTRSSRCTPQPQESGQHFTLAYQKLLMEPGVTKKTCPSRSKERHSCQLVTCTSSRQASSSAGSSCEPASPAFRNEHHPAHPHRDIDAFATGDRLIAIFREANFPWNNSTALIKLVHENPSTSFAAQPCGPQLR